MEQGRHIVHMSTEAGAAELEAHLTRSEKDLGHGIAEFGTSVQNMRVLHAQLHVEKAADSAAKAAAKMAKARH